MWVMSVQPPEAPDLRRRALVADNDPGRRAYLVSALERRGFAVLATDQISEVLPMIRQHSPDVALIRHEEPDDEAERAAGLACMAHPMTRIILTADRGAMTGDMDDGAVPVLLAPIDPQALDRCLADLLI